MKYHLQMIVGGGAAKVDAGEYVSLEAAKAAGEEKMKNPEYESYIIYDNEGTAY